MRKNSGKAPSFQFYYKDWLSDHRLKRCSKRAKGVWIDLIAVSCDLDVKGVFLDESGRFDREEILDLLTGNRKENSLGLNELIKRNIIKQTEDGTFYVKRIKRDAELAEIRREAGKKGGNPNLVKDLDKQKPNQNSKQNPTPSSSTSSSSSKKKYSPNSDEFRLSNLLLDLILQRNPKHKKPNIQTWAKHIDRMIRLDNRTPHEINKVIVWSQSDPFWQRNILSTDKLRHQFDRLVITMDMKKPEDTKSCIVDHKPGYKYQEDSQGRRVYLCESCHAAMNGRAWGKRNKGDIERMVETRRKPKADWREGVLA